MGRGVGEGGAGERGPGREPGEFHRVEGYRTSDGDRVRPHFARNPQRRRPA